MSDEEATEPDPIVTKSITISELMDGDGERWISIDVEGDLEPWDQAGLLEYGRAAIRWDIEQSWCDSNEED